MEEKDFSLVTAKIEAEKEFLGSISDEIWKHPELGFKEVRAHDVLTKALEKHGFSVKKHYFVPTAFRAEFCSKAATGPTIAVMCEYDALPEIGHACGHNLIAETGIAAGLGVKAAMEADRSICGKIVVLGTPAEEGGGGKIKLIDSGAFDDIDVAMMAHPSRRNMVFPNFIGYVRVQIAFEGKEAHASGYPWEGINALDAAVACYNNIAMLRQHIKPLCRIHGIIKKGGEVPNVIPGDSELLFLIRAPTVADLKALAKRVEACITGAASATGCQATYEFDFKSGYKNLLTNKRLALLYKKHAERMGLEFQDGLPRTIESAASTDMGNVSQVVPAFHVLFGLDTPHVNHSRGYTAAAGDAKAQPVTLIAGKAMALVALEIMRHPQLVEHMKNQLKRNLEEDAETSN